MSQLVVGIFPQSSPKSIEDALQAQNIDLTKVKVVTNSGADPQAVEDSPLDFVDVALAMESNSLSDDMTKHTGIMSDSGGTGVPGIGDTGPTLSAFSSHEAWKGYLGGFEIPRDEIENFNEAIEDGRAVVAYPDAGADETRIAAAFRAAGLLNVRAY